MAKNAPDNTVPLLMKVLEVHGTELQLAVTNAEGIGLLMQAVKSLSQMVNTLTALAAITAAAMEQVRQRLGLPPNPAAVAIMQAMAVAEQTVPDVAVANDMGAPQGSA